MIPGEVITADGDIELNAGLPTVTITVANTGDRPIQVGSHYHFFETNPALSFDRAAARGCRLDIAAGTAVRFEPGQSREVRLVSLSGNRRVWGHNNLINGPLDAIPAGDMKVQQSGLRDAPDPRGGGHISSTRISRAAYADMFGPTTGDKVRLGDTELVIEVERDFATYGEELKFGAGKVVRDGMGQSQATQALGAVDTVITNALIVDHWGIVKADIGIKDGLISGIGKAGNPDIQPGVTVVIGPGTDVVAGEGRIITSGGVDTNAHFSCPEQVSQALASGITTMIGGGTGPSTGTSATSCTPSPTNIRQMLQSFDSLPINFGIIGKGNASLPGALVEQIEAGACALKLNECWGTTPAAIDNCLAICDDYDVQCHIHSDTMNESGFVEDTIAAFKGRTIQVSHVEGAGGGHAPDIINVARLPNVLPSSTTSTRPYTVNTLDMHLDMAMVTNHLDPNIAEDVAFAESLIRGETIAAEDILHDLGAISIIGSGSQAKGRCGEVITCMWQTADKMKRQRGKLHEENGNNDNFRVKRYISKYTINPAIASGINKFVGSVEVGKLADLVVWDRALFGTKPSLIMKSGLIVAAQMGDPAACLSTVQPVIAQPMFALAVPTTSILFVSKRSIELNTDKDGHMYGLSHRVEAVRETRGRVLKDSMIHNNATPLIMVDAETYEVIADGIPLTCEPATVLPMAQRYYLF